MLEQLSGLLSPLATVLAVVLAYFLGKRQTINERLYTQRAEVIAELFKRFEDLDQRVSSLVSPFGTTEDPGKREEAKLVVESFNNLQNYYRSNSIWLPRKTSYLFNQFLTRYRQTINDFVIKVIINEDRHSALVKEWDEVQQRFDKESPDIREALEVDFRAIIDPPPWWDALLRVFERLHTRNQKSTSDVPTESKSENPVDT